MRRDWPYSQLVRFPRRWSWRKHKATRVHLERHEAAMILRDIEEMGGSATAHLLYARYPDRYHRRHLPGALKRMTEQNYLTHKGFGLFGSRSYELKAELKSDERQG